MKITNVIVNTFRNLGRKLVVNRNEPQIAQKRDRYGNLYWQVYDFNTNKSYSFGSDREVRAWLENRYHRA